MGRQSRKKRTRPTKPEAKPDEFMKLMEPLLVAIEQRTGSRQMAQEIIGQEASGVLAWGVRSGYLLWVRTHPGQIPTMEEVRRFITVG